jgi:hypothetical protein
LPEPFVLKPLGPGNFEADGRQYVAFARTIRVADLGEADLLEAPFLAQETIGARLHLRVATVGGRAWVAELDGVGLPLDWREHAPAHYSFRASPDWPAVERNAVALAAALRVGFSCQDWVVDDNGPVFLDLNPGGQWLFLPDVISKEIAHMLADWLAVR